MFKNINPPNEKRLYETQNFTADFAHYFSNRIGTQADGISPLGNGGNGVEIVVGGVGNFIGGTGANDGNIIAFNSGGVFVDFSLNPNANKILRNLIFSNGGLGIDLGFDGVTPNDPDDVDTGGGNNRQNFPVLSTVATAGGMTTIQGSLNSIPNTNFRIEFFVNSSCDASFHGEGRICSVITVLQKLRRAQLIF